MTINEINYHLAWVWVCSSTYTYIIIWFANFLYFKTEILQNPHFLILRSNMNSVLIPQNSELGWNRFNLKLTTYTEMFCSRARINPGLNYCYDNDLLMVCAHGWWRLLCHCNAKVHLTVAGVSLWHTLNYSIKGEF